MDYESDESSGASISTAVKRKSFSEIMQQEDYPTFKGHFYKMATNLLSCDDYSNELIKNFKRQLSRPKIEFKTRWQKVGRHSDRFLIETDTCAEGTLTMPSIFRQPASNVSQPKALKALAMFVEADLSKHQYKIIRNTNKCLYPSYSVIKKAKLECYPSKGSYRLRESCPEIKLQNLLNVTAARLLLHCQNDVLKDFNEEECDSLNCELTCQWGYDGNQSEFLKKLQDHDLTDSRIFLTYFVPLHLTCGSTILWQNPKPSSERFCRPIRIRFVRGKTNVTKYEIRYIENLISELKPLKYITECLTANVNFTLESNMRDDNVCEAATKTKSTISRYIETIDDELISKKIFCSDMRNEKLLNHLVLRSDPLLTSIRPRARSQKKKTARSHKKRFEDSDSESGEDSSLTEEESSLLEDDSSLPEEDTENSDEEAWNYFSW